MLYVYLTMLWVNVLELAIAVSHGQETAATCHIIAIACFMLCIAINQGER